MAILTLSSLHWELFQPGALKCLLDGIFAETDSDPIYMLFFQATDPNIKGPVSKCYERNKTKSLTGRMQLPKFTTVIC